MSYYQPPPEYTEHDSLLGSATPTNLPHAPTTYSQAQYGTFFAARAQGQAQSSNNRKVNTYYDRHQEEMIALPSRSNLNEVATSVASNLGGRLSSFCSRISKPSDPPDLKFWEGQFQALWNSCAEKEWARLETWEQWLTRNNTASHEASPARWINDQRYNAHNWKKYNAMEARIDEAVRQERLREYREELELKELAARKEEVRLALERQAREREQR